MRIMPIAMLAVLLLAGCASKGGGGDGAGDGGDGTASGTQTGTSTRSGSASGSASATGTSSPGANRPPLASLNAVANGTLARFNLTGTDPDGDALAWTLSFGDGNETNGASLPATIEHTYAPGNYTARYNVTDGRATASRNVTVSISGPAAGGPKQVVSGSWAIGVSDVGAPMEFLECEIGPSNEATHFAFTIEAATRGKPFTATLSDASDGAAVEGWVLQFMHDGCEIGDDASAAGTAPLSGTVPATAILAIAFATGGADFAFGYTAG